MTMIFDVSMQILKDDFASYQSSKISAETYDELFDKIKNFTNFIEGGIIDNISITQFAKKERERKTKNE